MKHSSMISDELLSAYIDNQVDEAELRRVEKAVVTDPAVQYQLESLQATVALMQNAPTLQVPRTLLLSENQVLAAGGQVKNAQKNAFWQRWLPRLIPVATAIVAILFVFSLTLNPDSNAPEPVKLLVMPRATESMGAPAPAMAREAAAEPNVQALSAEQPPSSRSAQPRNAVGVEAPTIVVEQDESEAVKELSIEPKTTPAAPISSAEKRLNAISWFSWLLGLLLILAIFLTWRITFVRSRRQ